MPKTSFDTAQRRAGTVAYEPALDGLRAIAVLAVLVSHFGLGAALAPVHGFLPWGHMGVQLFFVLSGFLITSILLNCRDRILAGAGMGQTLKAFYLRRALRIFPAYYATILLVFLFGADEFKEIVVYHLLYLSNTSAAIYTGPAASGGLVHVASAHFWSLSVEEQFYLFWPLVVFLVPRKHLPAVGICLILLAPVTRAGLFLIGYENIIGYLPATTDSLGAGALLAIWKAGHIKEHITRHFKAAVLLGALIFLACILSYNLDMFYRPRRVLLPLGEALVYAALINLLLSGRLPQTAAALRWRPLVSVGRVSYAIYLIHTFVMAGAIAIVPSFELLPGFTQFLIGTGATIALAMLSWKVFEGPINAQKAQFPYPAAPVSGKS